MLTARQVSLLSEMGIPVWQLRQSQAKKAKEKQQPDKSEQQDVATLSARIESVNWLICHDSEHSEQIKRLMHGMLLSIDVERTEVCLLTIADLIKLATMEISHSEQKRLLLFGEQTVKQVFGDAATVEQLRYEPQLSFKSKLTTSVSLNLDLLLTTPEQKKQVWQDLCRAKQPL